MHEFARRTLAITSCAALLATSFSQAAGPRVLPEGEFPKDSRLGPLKDLNGYFPFAPATNRADWDTRAERVRRQLLVSLGLWPLPTRTPLNPVIHGRVDCGDYTVERVFFESAPGFFVTGSLYRPKGKAGKLPVVLCPHGHWPNGRFMEESVDAVRRQIVQGGERFEEGGRSVLQARCVQLARMGCVVFLWDMLGYADSGQIPMELAHGFKQQRPEMNTTENWGLFSPQAESHLQSVMGLQTWNAIRSLDFVLSLPEVDPARVAVTGASGGGTQTFILGAVDPRPAVAFPAVMVSTAMQGGCTCENACGLRIGTGNVEFAALFAPKPLGMTAADDWTKEMPAKGFPELQQHFAMLGGPKNVMLKPLLHFGHNYNYVSRAAMYAWLNQHLRLDLKDPIVEEDYRRLMRDELSVWDAQHPQPPGGPDFERKLLHWFTEDAARQLAATPQSPGEFRRVIGGALEVVIGRNPAEVGQVEAVSKNREDRGSYVEVTGFMRNLTHGEEVPAVLLRPKQWNRRTVVWLCQDGKAGLFSETATGGGQPKAEIQKLLDAGIAVAGLDLFGQGEFQAEGKLLARTRRVENSRAAAAYTFGYNHTVFAQRVHDILSVIKLTRESEPAPEMLALVGVNGAGPWVAAARALAGSAVDRAVVDTSGFRFGHVLDLQSPDFLPGGAKYFDLPGMIALSAPNRLFLAGEGKTAPEVVTQVYDGTGAGDQLTVFGGETKDVAEAAVKWLLK